jgi:hypothetical protein
MSRNQTSLWQSQIVFGLLSCAANGSPLIDEPEWLNYELDTKVFNVNVACFVGAVNGSGFAPMVYEMPEV